MNNTGAVSGLDLSRSWMEDIAKAKVMEYP